MIDLSIIIPSRSPQYLNQTIQDFLLHSETNIEVIVVLDGIWHEPIDDKRVIYIHQGTTHNAPGMREAINKGVAISQGKFILKADEHVSVSQGYDRILMADCADNEVIIPRRGRLDVEKWGRLDDPRPDIDYMYIEYPFLKPFDSTQGLHGAEWRQRYYDRQEILIDETPSWQGSFWFMTRKHWDNIGEMDSEKYGPFTMEAQEIGMKTWLSGGRVLVNKKATYLHLHKGRKGKGYGFSSAQYEVFMAAKEQGRQFAIDYWLNTKDYKYDWEWFVNKFPDMPGWEGDWKARLEQDKLKDFRYSPEFTTWKAHWYGNRRTWGCGFRHHRPGGPTILCLRCLELPGNSEIGIREGKETFTRSRQAPTLSLL